MTILRARSRWWWGLAVVLLLAVSTSACTAAPRPSTSPDATDTARGDLIIDRAANLVLDANTLYEEVVIESSRAYFNGVLDDETFDTVKRAAEKVERSIRAAKVAVETYDALRSTSNAAMATALLDALEVVKGELDVLWESDDGK